MFFNIKFIDFGFISRARIKANFTAREIFAKFRFPFPHDVRFRSPITADSRRLRKRR